MKIEQKFSKLFGRKMVVPVKLKSQASSSNESSVKLLVFLLAQNRVISLERITAFRGLFRTDLATFSNALFVSSSVE